MGNTDIFDQIASKYDTPERIYQAKIMADAIREVVVDAKDKRAIDFGCGTGLVGMNVLDEFGSMLFVDTSSNMIQQLEQKIAELQLENVETLCFDLEQEHRTDLKADYIIMTQVLLHIRDVEMILSRLYDLLHPEGHLIIVDFDKNDEVVSDLVHNGFEQEQLASLMTGIGYTDIQSKTFYTGSKIFMGKDASLFILDAQK